MEAQRLISFLDPLPMLLFFRDGRSDPESASAPHSFLPPGVPTLPSCPTPERSREPRELTGRPGEAAFLRVASPGRVFVKVSANTTVWKRLEIGNRVPVEYLGYRRV